MKVLVVLSALAACAVADPLAFSYSNIATGWGAPWAAGIHGGIHGGLIAAPGLRSIATPYAASIAAPYAASIAAPYAASIAAPYAAPIAAPLAAPIAVAAPDVVKTQYHAQDELGQASYGHSEPLQTHHAIQDAHGNKVGSFSYLNPTDGHVHRTDYVADGLGYRVAANDLPVGPSVPVLDTPEVVAARSAHLLAHAHRLRRSILLGHTPAATAPLAAPVAVASPLAYSGIASPLAYSGVASPLAYSGLGAPLIRDALLTTIVNNPGHAVSYRVD